MADPYVRQARGVFTGTIGSTAVVAGDALYFDGTDWELADATDNTKFAEAFAVNSYSSAEVGALCRSAIIVDTDAPYTQGDQYYLSETAGELTATHIKVTTTAEAVVQLLGFGLSTSELYVDIPPLRYETMTVPLPYNVHSAPIDRDGDFVGHGLDDINAEVSGSFTWPRNLIAVEEALLWWCGTGTELDASDTYTIDASAGVDDETTSTTTDGITAAALTVAANDLAVADVSACFDASGLAAPGNICSVTIKKAAEGSAGDDAIMLSVSIGVVVC